MRRRSLVTTACACTDHTIKIWYIAPGLLCEWGPRYKAIPHCTQALIFCCKHLGTRYLAYKVFMVRAHAVVTRPLSTYKRQEYCRLTRQNRPYTCLFRLFFSFCIERAGHETNCEVTSAHYRSVKDYGVPIVSQLTFYKIFIFHYGHLVNPPSLT